MKILKLVYLTFVCYALTGSYVVFADVNVPNPGFKGSNIRTTVGRRDAFRPPNFRNSWTLDFKISQMKKIGILGDTLKEGKFDFIRDIFHSFKNLPDSVSRIHMYGDGRPQNTTALIFGNVNEGFLENYIVKDLHHKDGKMPVYSKKILVSGLKNITKLTIQLDNNQGSQEKIVYFSTVKPGIYVISSNIYEVRRWRDYPRSVIYYANWPNYNTIFSLRMDVQRTLKNMQKNDSQETYMLKSKIFKEARNMVLLVEEGDSDIFIAGYVITKDQDQVEGLKQIFNELLSNNDIESDDDIRNQLFDNLEIIQNKKSLKIGSVITKSSFNTEPNTNKL